VKEGVKYGSGMGPAGARASEVSAEAGLGSRVGVGLVPPGEGPAGGRAGNRRPHGRRAALAFAGVLATLAGRARADQVDGAPIEFGERPIVEHDVRACSFREPVCVHARGGTAPDKVLAVLSSVGEAWQAATWGLGLPPPATDLTSGAFDVYLVGGGFSGAEADLAEQDPLASFDRASAFLRVSLNLEGCALDTALARETAHAILWRTAPATDPATARAESSYLARLMVPCALEAADDIDVYQAHPEASVTGSLRGTSSVELPDFPTGYADGASLFYWWLDDAFGNSPGSVVRALWALAPTETPLGRARWAGRPNIFDVLEASFKNALTTGSTMDDLFLDFAVARAFVGRTSDADRMIETRALGEAGMPRTEWDVVWPKKPRSLASARSIEPTGAAYVGVDCRGAPPAARLRFEAEWEEHAKMRWAAVKLDAEGHELSAIAIPSKDRGTEAQFTVVDLDGVVRVLFVGTNTGDPFVAFAPSDETPEPHGWLVRIAEESTP
jgi:hypothetical protein